MNDETTPDPGGPLRGIRVLEFRTGTGFDSIFDAPNFAGGGFSFFNRLGIRLAGTGVALVDRGSLFTSLRSSKDEGQPNYVNPGVALITTGLDVEVTPRLKAIFTGNYIRLDAVEPVAGGALLVRQHHQRRQVCLPGAHGTGLTGSDPWRGSRPPRRCRRSCE